jgi:hypothetical protein
MPKKSHRYGRIGFAASAHVESIRDPAESCLSPRSSPINRLRPMNTPPAGALPGGTNGPVAPPTNARLATVKYIEQ